MSSRKLVFLKSFDKSFKKFVKGNYVLQENIEKTLRLMEADVFAPTLKAHKLSGKLLGLIACSCGYDCRIIFSIEKHSGHEVILLIDIGTHDEIY
ncbi:MAG: type II toxin-antitoxin system mRNA interferase toxin, RelE/StbE family [Bacteroidetes bacterium]|nr:type II toxin-antitoxin system mRNA interferase toxin, RelE/StbE family [Bacteroidota bacterium]